MKEPIIKHPKILTEFKKFILRGNVVDLAVAVVIGAAFTAVVNGFVNDFLTPLINAVQGHSHFEKYVFMIHHITFTYGDFLNILLKFLLTASVVFFFVVKLVNHLMELSRKKEPTPDPTTRKCPECLGEVPILAKRCMYCTSTLKPEKAKD